MLGSGAVVCEQPAAHHPANTKDNNPAATFV
jgi:hypothetical protein